MRVDPAIPGTQNIVAVAIPAYRCSEKILAVVNAIGPEVHLIFVVDDACPQGSGKAVEDGCTDRRVHVLYHPSNQGVGGAMVTAYQAAKKAGATVIVKMDGDGQMNPKEIPKLIQPILQGRADYVKGNRFFTLESLRKMPSLRLIGNAGLSFLSKLSSGYWSIMDPTNGFTAVSVKALEYIPMEKLEKRFFFENDFLFRLGTVRAVVRDIPLPAQYADEVSNLNPLASALSFPPKFTIRIFKRILYNYFLRDFNFGSLSLLIGIPSLSFGMTFGIYHWVRSYQMNTFTPPGTVMVATLPVILGMQFIIAAIHYDIEHEPRNPLSEN